MTYWYNEVGKDEKYAVINAGKMDEMNSSIEASEVVVRKDDTFYYLFGQFNKMTDIKKYGNNDWRFEPQLAQIKFAHKNYEKYDKVKKSNIAIEQHNIEKLASKILSTLDESIVYKAILNIQDSNIVKMLVEEKDATGNPIAPQTYSSLLISYFYFVPVLDEPQYIDIGAIKLPVKNTGNGWGSGGSKAQSEYDKLNDRVKFIIEQTKLAYPDSNVSNVMDVTNMLLTTKDYAGFWDILGQIIRN